MDIKSIIQTQLGGGDYPTHPNFASRPAVTYDVNSRTLIYNQSGNIVKVQVPLGRNITTSGSIVLGDENTILTTDTSAGSILLSLPINPNINDTYYLLDSKAMWGINKITLDTNIFFGVSNGTYDLKLQSAIATIRYISNQIGWVVMLSSSPVSATPGGASPLMNSVASVGTATAYSREDHIHPTDTTRAPINNPSFTGTALLNGVSMTPPSPQIDSYITNSGSPFTWTKPANAKLIDVYLCSGGGGGGSGSKGTATTVALSGGGGGGGGAINHYQFISSQVGATATINIGAGGTGGASVSSASTNGVAGGTGGGTSFTSGTLTVRSNSVGGATIGTWSGTTGVSGTGNSSAAGNGYNGTIYSIGGVSYLVSGQGAQSTASLTTNRTTDLVTGVVLPGLVGGSIAVAGTALTPAVNQATHNASSTFTSSTISPGSISVPGENGVGKQIGFVYYSFGGSGGSASITPGVAAVSGGNGIYGSGGGGGGAALDTAGSSGAGGRGGDGWCVIVTTF